MKTRILYKSMLSCILYFWVIQNILAQSPILIKDINPGSASSNPLYMTAFLDGVFFIADDGVNGQEHWISDGTEAGTFMLKDIYPGSNEPFYARNPLAVGNLIFFICNDGTHGGELWVSDGTVSGTYGLTSSDQGISNISDIAFSNGVIYFNGNGIDVGGESVGKELFKITDVTSADRSSEWGKQTAVISIYPNPNSGHITINLPAEYTGQHIPYTVYNYTGVKIMSGIVIADILDLSMLAPGIYIVKIELDQGAFSEKITVIPNISP